MDLSEKRVNVVGQELAAASDLAKSYIAYIDEVTLAKAFDLGAYSSLRRTSAVHGTDLLQLSPLCLRLGELLGGPGGSSSQKKLSATLHRQAVEYACEKRVGVNKTTFGAKQWAHMMQERVMVILAHWRKLKDPKTLEFASRCMADIETTNLKGFAGKAGLVGEQEDEERSVVSLSPKTSILGEGDYVSTPILDIEGTEVPTHLLEPRGEKAQARDIIPPTTGALKKQTLEQRAILSNKNLAMKASKAMK